MSWLSEFLHSPIDYIKTQPLKALSLLAAPVAAFAAPFAAPAIGGALGLGGAGAGAAAGIGEAALGAGAEAAGGGSLLGWLGAGGEAAGGGAGLFSALGEGAAGGAGEGGASLASLISGASPEALSANASAFAPDFSSTFGAFGSGGGATAGSGGSLLDGLGGALSGGADAAGGAAGAAPTAALDYLAPAAGALDAGLGGATGAAPAAGESGGFFSNLLSGATSQLTKNPLGIGLAAGGLGYNLLQGQQVSPEMQAMEGQAKALSDQSKQLMSYLQQGTLPPGLQAGVQQATAAMKARIIANHARNGMSTDPSQNSALAQELNGVDANALTLVAQQGVQLLNSGLSMAQIGTSLYGQLENLNRQQAASTGKAIAAFASALNGAPQLRLAA